MQIIKVNVTDLGVVGNKRFLLEGHFQPIAKADVIF